MGNTAAVGSPAVGSPGGSQAIPEDASPDEQLAKLASQFKGIVILRNSLGTRDYLRNVRGLAMGQS